MTESKKYTKETISAKQNIRKLRLMNDYSVNKGAELLGVSRKKMEDIETTQNYGCFLSLDLLVRVSKVYKVSLDALVSDSARTGQL